MAAKDTTARRPGSGRKTARTPVSQPAPQAATTSTTTLPTPDTEPSLPKGNLIMNPTSFDAVGSVAREHIEKAQQNVYKSFEEISKLQKDNWDAMLASSQIWAKGAEVISKAWMGFAQESMENAASAAKALVGVKSLREAVDLQTDLAKGNFDKFVAESTKISETVVKVANDAMEPIAARMNVNVEKMFKPVAA
jgi:phasin family protein